MGYGRIGVWENGNVVRFLTALVMRAIMLTGMRPAPRMRSRLPPSYKMANATCISHDVM